jgi:transcriptional regulator with XRE-family HTH domain
MIPAERATGPGPGSARTRPARPRTFVLDGQRLRHLRRQRGLSQQELADHAGLSLTTVARLERQKAAPCRGRTLGRLARALGEHPAATSLRAAESGAAPAPKRLGIAGPDRARMLSVAGRALSFGARAEAYERFRPGYPAELYGMVMTYAGRRVRTALEIGAGTGQATRLFAQRGIVVTATEPDGAMLAELRKQRPPDVRTVQAAFEELPPGERYGLVYAAAALHWTSPEGRWPRVAALLEPGGVLAVFGGPVQLADRAVEDAVRTARAPFLDSDEVPSPDGTPPGHGLQWPGTELQRSEWFADVQQAVIERRLTVSARDYVGYLSTVSAYLELPAPAQEQVYSRIMRVLPDTVEIAADITVHLARRRDER